jgi:hypothetical protein
VSEFSYQFLWHQIRVVADDAHTFAAEVPLEFSILGGAGSALDVFEGPDFFVSVGSAKEAAQAIARRVECRVNELVGLKGWNRFRGVLSPQSSDPTGCALALGGFGVAARGVGSVAVRRDQVLPLLGSGYPLVSGIQDQGAVALRPLSLLVLAELKGEPGGWARLGPLAAVEALMAHAESSTESSRDTVRSALALAQAVPAYRLWADSAENLWGLAKNLVDDPPAS